MGNSQFFCLHDFSRLKINFFSEKVSDICHGSVEVRKTFFKALQTSVEAE